MHLLYKLAFNTVYSKYILICNNSAVKTHNTSYSELPYPHPIFAVRFNCTYSTVPLNVSVKSRKKDYSSYVRDGNIFPFTSYSTLHVLVHIGKSIMNVVECQIHFIDIWKSIGESKVRG